MQWSRNRGGEGGGGGARGAIAHPPNIPTEGPGPPIIGTQYASLSVATEDIQPEQIHENKESSSLQLVKVYIHVES